MKKENLFFSSFPSHKTQSLLCHFTSHSRTHCWPPGPILLQAEAEGRRDPQGQMPLSAAGSCWLPCLQERHCFPCSAWTGRRSQADTKQGKAPNGVQLRGLTALVRDPCPSSGMVTGQQPRVTEPPCNSRPWAGFPSSELLLRSAQALQRMGLRSLCFLMANVCRSFGWKLELSSMQSPAGWRHEGISFQSVLLWVRKEAGSIGKRALHLPV